MDVQIIQFRLKAGAPGDLGLQRVDWLRLQIQVDATSPTVQVMVPRPTFLHQLETSDSLGPLLAVSTPASRNSSVR